MPRKILVSAVGIAAYLIGRRILLPVYDTQWALHPPPITGISVFRLGIAPFVTGFLVVELFSLVIPMGRRLRRQGVAGRAKLNRAALIAGTLLVLAQAWSTVQSLSTLSGEWPRVEIPAGVEIATLAAASFALLGLAGIISRWGLGNGLVLLFVVHHLLRTVLRGDSFSSPEGWMMSALLSAGLVGVALLVMRRTPTVALSGDGGEDRAFRIPAFPQGVTALVWAFLLVNLLVQPGMWLWERLPPWLPWGSLPGHRLIRPLLHPGLVSGYVLLFAMIVGSSFLTAQLFSAPGRVATNLAGAAEVDEGRYRPPWRRQLLLTTFLLVLLEVGRFLGGHFVPDAAKLLVGISGTLYLAAVALDLFEEGRLSRRGPLARVLTLDNVHLAEHFRARFEQEGIPVVVRAYHFRRLLYFFGPLFKMALLVPEEERERAEALVEASEAQIA